jgi:hypothetical protein
MHDIRRQPRKFGLEALLQCAVVHGSGYSVVDNACRLTPRISRTIKCAGSARELRRHEGPVNPDGVLFADGGLHVADGEAHRILVLK